MPPCGGAPKRSARSRKPKRASASSAVMPTTASARSCRSGRLMRIEPAAGLVPVDDEVVGLRQHRAGIGLSSSASCSGRGAVKTWCSATQPLLVRVAVVGAGSRRPRRTPRRPPGSSSKRCARCGRSAPSTRSTTGRSSAARKIASPWLGAGRLAQAGDLGLGEELGDRRAHLAATRRAAGTRAPCRPTPWRTRPARRARAAAGRRRRGTPAQRTTPPPSAAPRKTPNSEPRTSSRDVRDLEAEAQVGPVGAVAEHRLGVA